MVIMVEGSCRLLVITIAALAAARTHNNGNQRALESEEHQQRRKGETPAISGLRNVNEHLQRRKCSYLRRQNY